MRYDVKMKIMIVNTYYYPDIIGGAEISTQKLAEGLKNNGHNVYVLCSSENEERNCINGVNVFRISCIKVSKLKKILNLYNFMNYKKIKEIIETIQPDIIHTNNLMEISYSIWIIGHHKKIPIVHTLRDYALISSNINAAKLKRQLSKNVTAVTAPSDFILNGHIGKKYFMAAKAKKVIFNATDIPENYEDIFENKINNKLDGRNITKFGFIGRFEEYKGILWLIKIFKKIDRCDIDLSLFGKGSLLETVKEEIKNDRRITYCGFLNEQQLRVALNNIDVVIVPSLWEEPFGRTILDAYCNGIPVIVTQKGGMPEIVEDYKTGRVIPCTDQALTEAITFYCNEKNVAMTLKNIESILPKFSIKMQVQKFEVLYKQMI